MVCGDWYFFLKLEVMLARQFVRKWAVYRVNKR